MGGLTSVAKTRALGLAMARDHLADTLRRQNHAPTRWLDPPRGFACLTIGLNTSLMAVLNGCFCDRGPVAGMAGTS